MENAGSGVLKDTVFVRIRLIRKYNQRMKKTYLLLAALAMCATAAAQNIPPYVHSFGNLYLENSAAAGINGYPVVYLTYHKQVIRNIEGTPEHASVSFHSPISGGRSSFGTNVSYFRQGIQQTSNAYATFAHRLEFGGEQSLQLGVSGGFFYNSLNTNGLSDAELADPVLANVNRKFLADIRFGMVYQLKNLQIGASLPRLLPYYGTATGQERVTPGFKPLKNYTVHAAYRIHASPDVIIHPMVLYRKYEYQDKGFFEFNGLVNYKDAFWLGGAYRQEYGMFLTAGVKAQERLSIGYAYKLSNNQMAGYGNPAHEIQLGIHLGKKPALAAKTLPAFRPLRGKTIRTAALKVKLDTNIRMETVRRTVEPAVNPLEMDVDIYLVVGSFRYVNNAKAYTADLQRQGLPAKMGFNTAKQLHYVYVFNSTNERDVRAEVYKLRRREGFKKAWMLRVVQE